MTQDHEETETAPRVWTQAGFVADDWRRAEDPAALSGDGCFLVAPDLFMSLDAAQRQALAGRLGLSISPADALEPLLPHIAELPVVALGFPRFNDGRSYSRAVLLRERHRYEGDLRAFGDVLIDQVPHMLRCGFTSLEIGDPVAVARLEAGRTGGIALHYQPGIGTEDAAGYGWRRRSA